VPSAVCCACVFDARAYVCVCVLVLPQIVSATPEVAAVAAATAAPWHTGGVGHG